ncbi:MAG TPA: MerR family transcriptional regulator, partial [Candidatus Cloacimonadota bacterium]|nr:MerR family transcriptional regulator [Candidatus Cloacimonadota bacterium]
KTANVRNRRYDEKDIALLKLLKELIYEKKYTLEGAKIAINEYKKADKTVKKEKKEIAHEAAINVSKEALLEQLKEIRNFLMNK